MWAALSLGTNPEARPARAQPPAAARAVVPEAVPMPPRQEPPAEGAGAANEEAAAELPSVDLASRVPPRWLPGAVDDWPLRPERWRRRMPRRCQTRGGFRDHCQGERLVPTPKGPAAELARRMGLGSRATALQLMHRRPFEEWLALVADSDPEETLAFPVPGGVMGRGYGRTRTGSLRHRRHWGVDIGAAEGTPVVASRGGLAVFSDNSLVGFGNAVMVLHREGYTTFYAHCQRTLVFAGQRVTRGQVIGRVGATGFARAPHLHFEVRRRGWARDPVPFLFPRLRRR